MSVVTETSILRSLLHRMVEGLCDEIDRYFTSRAPAPTPPTNRKKTPAPPRPVTVGAPITLAGKRRHGAKDKPRPTRQLRSSDVTVSCRISNGHLEVAVSLCAEVAQRLEFKIHGKAGAVFRGGLLRVRAVSEGQTIYAVGPSGRLYFAVPADVFGVTERHAPETCAFHYDLEEALAIEPPAWLKRSAIPVSQPQMRSKDGKAEAQKLPASCKKRAPGPPIDCTGCGKAVATLECNICHEFLCDACWETHVRRHWHTERKSPAGTAARDARQAMRSPA